MKKTKLGKRICASLLSVLLITMSSGCGKKDEYQDNKDVLKTVECLLENEEGYDVIIDVIGGKASRLLGINFEQISFYDNILDKMNEDGVSEYYSDGKYYDKDTIETILYYGKRDISKAMIGDILNKNISDDELDDLINKIIFGYNLEDETVSGLSPVDRLKEYYYSGLSLEQAEAIIYFLEEASHKGGSISVMVNKAEELIRGGYTTAPDMITLEIEYIIQPGETLNSVASKSDTTVEKIVRRNKIADPDFIKAGDSIIVEAKMKVEYIDKSKTKTR